jgi:hypothetical protein
VIKTTPPATGSTVAASEANIAVLAERWSDAAARARAGRTGEMLVHSNSAIKMRMPAGRLGGILQQATFMAIPQVRPAMERGRAFRVGVAIATIHYRISTRRCCVLLPGDSQRRK